MDNRPILQVRCAATLGSLEVNVDFAVNEDWTVLFGPSGSGKSSLLRLIVGLWTPPCATVQFRGDDLSTTPPHRRHIGFVAQEPALFPHLDVLGNVMFGCSEKENAEAMLRLFGLEEFGRARVARLSGGERQRVALARALAAQPRLLLLDEVFTGMHLQLRDDLFTRVQEHCKRHIVPVLSVTHDPIEAGIIGGEVLRIEAGRIVSRGSAAETLANERQALRRALGAN